MPDKNEVEKIAAALVEALKERDPDAVLALVHSDYEFYSRLMAVEGRVYRGRNGFRDYFRDLDESFTARGRESGAAVEVPAAQVWTFHDGKVWRNVIHASREEALEAAGLSE